MSLIHANFVCGKCKTPTCSGVIFLCTGCTRSSCQGEVNESYAGYGRAQTPGYHLFVRGHGEMWECGPLREMTWKALEQDDIPKEEGDTMTTAAPFWIACSDRKPALGVYVLVSTRYRQDGEWKHYDGDMTVGKWTGIRDGEHGGWVLNGGEWYPNADQVTDWMSLPPRPVEEG